MRDKNYNRILNYDTQDTEHLAELILKGLGFQPRRESEFWDRRMAEFEVDRYWRAQRGLLLDQLWRSTVVDPDPSVAKDVRADIRRFNERAPSARYKITNKSVKQSFRNRGERRETLGQGRLPGVPEDLQLDFDRLFPREIGREKVKTAQ